ncbi:hypothetical protein HNR42_001597 [Deinobacterium chartae]|uniref:Lipoprotein n=1 Tax=Deinobacterium chartae TaxID=521158 RepID=A0A841I295_9DEIO|nr:hypothetical protein [Deinobacterium chartae]MBB6098172.1 hypothetical protein [Deinobacterium chartae]
MRWWKNSPVQCLAMALVILLVLGACDDLSLAPPAAVELEYRPHGLCNEVLLSQPRGLERGFKGVFLEQPGWVNSDQAALHMKQAGIYRGIKVPAVRTPPIGFTIRCDQAQEDARVDITNFPRHVGSIRVLIEETPDSESRIKTTVEISQLGP